MSSTNLSLIDLYNRSHRTGKMLLVLQIIAHLSLIPMVVFGSMWHWLGAGISYFLLVGVGFSVTYHRLLSHRSWNAPEWFRKVGIVLGALCAIGTPITFVSQHRYHHRYLDRPKDTYSIVNHPFWFVQWFTMLLPVSLKGAPDLLRDTFCVWVHKHFMGIHILTLLSLLVIDPFAVVYLYFVPIAIAWNTVNALNSIAHRRDYKGSNSSLNRTWLGYVTFGEGWHATHHLQPRRVNFGSKWWELDLGYYVIRAFEKRKLHS